jgi:hypothetical protein
LSVQIQVDIKEVWRICKKHMTPNQIEKAFEELNVYFDKCIKKRTSSEVAKQILGD